jgi:hypothetical protein
VGRACSIYGRGIYTGDPYKDLNVDNINMDLSVIGSGGLDWIFWFRIETIADICEHSNEPSSSMNFWEFLEWMSNYAGFPRGLGSMEFHRQLVCKLLSISKFF